MTTRTTTARLAAAAVALLLLGGTAACGTSGGDDAQDDAKTTTTKADATPTTGDDDDDTSTTTGDDDTTTTEDDDGPSADDAEVQDYVDALVADLGEDEQEVVTPEQGECLAKGWIDVIGFDELKDAGIAPEDFSDLDNDSLGALSLSEDEVGSLFDVFGECDFDFKEVFAEAFSEDGELTAEQQDCIDGLLTEEALRKSFIDDFFDREVEDDPLDALITCFPEFGPSADGPAADSPVTVTTAG